MSIPFENCKINPNCELVVPIDEFSSIGDSASAINLNFRNLDISLCNIATSAADLWNPAYTTLNSLSSDWMSMLTTIETYSSCWNDSYHTVAALSAFWLKPISMVYPYPFEPSESNYESTITTWLNITFPVKVNDCFNFIVGQELYIFTPEYTDINRYITADTELFDLDDPVVTIPKGNGLGLRKPTTASERKKYGDFVVKTAENSYRVTMLGGYRCIARPYTVVVRVDFKVDSIGAVAVVAPDKYIKSFVGLKFNINPDTYIWEFTEHIYNNDQ